MLADDKEIDEDLESYFNESEDIGDYLDLYVLRTNEELLEAFGAIFRGSTASTIARIFVLKGLAADKVLTSWSPSQLRTLFNVMDADKLDAIIARLRGSPILNYDPNDGLYRLSDIGRVAISSLNSITSFSQEDDTGLGFMFAQLAGNDSMGLDQSPEALRHILYRLNSLREDFEDSIISGSERRIKESERKLKSVRKFVGKGSDIISRLIQNDSLNNEAYRLAQNIGKAQGALLNSTSTVHRTLNQIERQRIDLGESGISASDISEWLIGKDIEGIASLIDGELEQRVAPHFILSDLLMDTAEEELLREHHFQEKEEMPPPVEAIEGSVDYEIEGSLEIVEEWMPTLQEINGKVKMSDIIKSESFSKSSYLMSLLSIVGAGGQGLPDNVIGDLAKLPLEVIPTRDIEKVDHVEVDEMSIVHIISKDVKS